MAIITHKHNGVVFKDNTGTPISATIGPGPGDFTHGEIEEGNVEAIDIMNRGDFLERVIGAEKAVEFAISVYHDGEMLGTNPGGAILKLSGFSAGVTLDPGGVVWGIDCVVTVTRGATSMTCTLKNCRVKFSYGEAADGNKLSITGVARGTGSKNAITWST